MRHSNSVITLFILLALSGCSISYEKDYAILENAVARIQDTADEALRKANSAQAEDNEPVATSEIEIEDDIQAIENISESSSAQEMAKQALEKAKAALKEAELATIRAERMFKLTQSK